MKTLNIGGITLFNRSPREYVFTIEGRQFWAYKSTMDNLWCLDALDESKHVGDFAHVTYISCCKYLESKGMPDTFKTLTALVLTVVDENAGIPCVDVY